MLTIGKIKERKPWIDSLRAIAMLFVMFGHISRNNIFLILTAPVKIPLFFAITGYVFNDRNGNTEVFFKNLLKTVFLPLVYFSCLILPVKCIASAFGVIDDSVASSVKNVLTGNEYWYLTCCVFAEIICFTIRKFAKSIRSYFVFAALLAIAGLLMARGNVLNIANINTAFIAQAFLFIGFFFKSIENRLSKRLLGYFGIILYFWACIGSMIFFPNKCIDIHTNSYYSLPLNFILILSGNFSLFFLASKLNFRSKILEQIGKNTLSFYFLHMLVIRIIQIPLKNIELIPKAIQDIFVFVISVFICLCASEVINRYFPFLVGKNKQKKER